ncbi:tyrosine-protein kinase receptor torso-like [Teleopsis dalmanni]|uniref:tyrosine-protein kinase receptor torso-like n=1 Tax=Teleopsis dalmanni TaxID=139649 RepID=UPI0018CD1294|nr:tyrosine-protein kinase receptor torso-like [Teleopsis dalmanni]
MTCTYDIICFPVTGGGNDLNPLEIRNPRQLYTYTLENLHFSMEYSLGIRAKNPNTISRESELFWSNFVVPSCVEWYNYDFNICAPLAPTGLDAEQIFIGENEFSVNISWNKPEYFPDYYTLRIMDIDEKGNAFTFNVSKAATYFLIPKITIYGSHYEIHLTAFTAGGKTSAYIDTPIKTIVMISDNNDLTNIMSAVLASILFVVIIGLTIFLIYYRKAKLKRHQERSKYFEELERKTPITDKSVTDYPKNTLFTVATKELANFQPHFDDVTIFNDDMEIDRHDVELLEILGEGAFGFVRRGIYKDKNSGPREVAVKMLKDQPSLEDMRGFRREIEVMKSVDKHPNIVGIIGHCTKCQNGMMLLTEYCSFGNLLDFLRDEWKHLHDSQMRTISELSKGRYEGISKESGDNTNLNYFNNNENSENFNTNATKMQEYNSKGIKSISNNNNNNVNYNNRIEDIIKASILTPAVSNVGYGYDQMCTSTCKCEVIITDTGAQINDNEIDPIKDTQDQIGSSDVDIERYFNSGPANKTIAIKNCECEKHKMAKKIKMVENKAYFEQMLKNGNNQKEHTKLDGKVDALQFSVHREPLSVGDLADIAKQVALGMEFLSMNKVVHRDLAARNVLVTPDRTVKIADFGLSRDVYRENIYQKTGNGKLPIKWMALESLTHQIYTTQSDVWSYGILLYEIVTLGGSPYPAIPTNRLVQYLKSGHRMDKPIHCEQQLYDLMLTCWNANPADRPTFTEILQKLDKFLVKELTDKTEYTTNVTTLNLYV